MGLEGCLGALSRRHHNLLRRHVRHVARCVEPGNARFAPQFTIISPNSFSVSMPLHKVGVRGQPDLDKDAAHRQLFLLLRSSGPYP